MKKLVLIVEKDGCEMSFAGFGLLFFDEGIVAADGVVGKMRH